RLQEQLFALGNPYSGLWRLAPDEPRLHYELAGLSLPLMVGQWKLTAFEPADKRDSSARVRYTQALVNGPLSVEVSVYYDETQRGRDATQRQESLKRYQGTPANQARMSAMPDLPFGGLTSVKGGAQWEDAGERGFKGIWTVLNGDWHLHVAVEFALQDEAQAIEQLGQLFATLQWQGEHPLFRERTLAEQDRAIDEHWATPGGWSKAGELAQQALPDAFFALEVARLNTFVGVSQYRRGALEDARRSLEQALSAWEYSGGDPDGGIYQTALDYAADIAYRQGRSREAIALNRALLDWQQSDALWGWGIPEGGKALVNRATGMQLPMRVGTYRLSYGAANRFYYENLQTGGQLGLSAGLEVSSDDELESTLRRFMADTLQLQAGRLRKTTFVPRSVQHQAAPVAGRKWVFDVTPGIGDKGEADVDPITGAQRATPTGMAFWIVDRKGQRSLLRAPIMRAGQTETEANQIAQALSW
ncbi:tetratricopeptide repeat protein, partial [Pseudomonas sp. NPDC089530]|uniref:tetratricopeptide repeat protein n=1 Tax=Pseudomonas sp. NPDC089530 TaxID=3390651 RepID=UPI003D013EBA